jgi:hypothetical protein
MFRLDGKTLRAAKILAGKPDGDDHIENCHVFAFGNERR